MDDLAFRLGNTGLGNGPAAGRYRNRRASMVEPSGSGRPPRASTWGPGGLAGEDWRARGGLRSSTLPTDRENMFHRHARVFPRRPPPRRDPESFMSGSSGNCYGRVHQWMDDNERFTQEPDMESGSADEDGARPSEIKETIVIKYTADDVKGDKEETFQLSMPSDSPLPSRSVWIDEAMDAVVPTLESHFHYLSQRRINWLVDCTQATLNRAYDDITRDRSRQGQDEAVVEEYGDDDEQNWRREKTPGRRREKKGSRSRHDY